VLTIVEKVYDDHNGENETCTIPTSFYGRTSNYAANWKLTQLEELAQIKTALHLSLHTFPHLNFSSQYKRIGLVFPSNSTSIVLLK
jgi:hypothetical protein